MRPRPPETDRTRCTSAAPSTGTGVGAGVGTSVDTGVGTLVTAPAPASPPATPPASHRSQGPRGADVRDGCGVVEMSKTWSRNPKSLFGGSGSFCFIAIGCNSTTHLRCRHHHHLRQRDEEQQQEEVCRCRRGFGRGIGQSRPPALQLGSRYLSPMATCGVVWRHGTSLGEKLKKKKKEEKKRKKKGCGGWVQKQSAVGAPVTPECRGLSGHSDRKG